MSNNYLAEAFKELNLLNEEVFDFSTTGAEDLKNFMDSDEQVDYEVVIDPDAETEDDIKDSYVGKVILCCSVCHSDLYKDADEVVIDDETQLANVGEECPYCYSPDGYKIIGQVAPYNKDADFSVENGEAEPKEEPKDEEPVEDEPVETSEEDESEEDEENLEESKKDDKVKTDLSKVKGSMTSVLVDNANKLKDITSKSELKKFISDLFEENDIDTKASKRLLSTIENSETDFEAINAVYQSILKGSKLGVNENMLNESVINEEIGKLRKLVDSEVEEFGYDRLPDGSGPFAIDADNFTLVLHGGPQGEAIITYKDDSDENDYEISYEFIDNDDAVGKFKEVFDVIKEDNSVVKDEFTECIKANADKPLTEAVKNVTVTTDSDTTNVEINDNGGVTVDTQPNKQPNDVATEDAEMIAPIAPDTEANIEDNGVSEEEPADDVFAPDFEEEDADIDEFDEDSFDELGESYLKEVYSNVKSFKTTKGSTRGNTIKLEGIITFNSGKQALTEFNFRSYLSKNGKYKFLGENLQINPKKNTYVLTGKIKDKKFISESLMYSYRSKDTNGKSQRIYGTARK